MRDGDFRVRGKDISRVEGLSDAVFGFAITLLVVSLEVPKSPAEVLHAMRGFFAFAITFALLFMVWRTQFLFFRRYGLEDDTTVYLNAVLLFTILFFIYPLKFLFTTFVDHVLAKVGFPDTTPMVPLSSYDGKLLGIAYGLGWAAVFTVFGLLYRHAYKQREKLQLDDLELFDTRSAITGTTSAATAGLLIAAMNAALAFLPRYEDQLAYGIPLVVAGLFAFVLRSKRGRRSRRRAIIESMRASVAS